jgi:WD40 repeat protein
MNPRTVVVRRLLFLVTTLTLVLLARPAAAQNDRRDRQDPELVVDSGGRQGTCDQLLFSPDGKHLLAAGDDKVVRIWTYADGKLSDKGQKLLRWSIWREQRGAIYALALSPDGQRVAVGGLGVRTSTVALIDRLRGNILGVVAPEGKPGENFFGVMALAFDPKGERIAYGTADGTVWLWDLHNNRRLGRHAVEGEFNRIRLVHFLDDNHVLSVAENGSVTRWDLAADTSEALPAIRVENYSLVRAALSPDGRWLAGAAKGPAVAVRSLDGTQQKDVTLEEGEFPRSLTFDPRSRRLAVGIGRVMSNFYVEGDDRIRIYDLSQAPPAAGNGPPHSGRADCLAFHPDGRHLAIAGGDNQEVTLWDLNNLDKPASLMRGAGSGIWEVGLSKDGKLVGFRNQRDSASTDPNRRARGPWRAFDLQQRTWLEPKEFQPQPYLAELDGWHVVPDRKDPYVWYAVDGDGHQYALPLDRDREGLPRCWTFLPPKKGLPTRLAVGHYWGLSVYELTAEGAKRTRLCAGHQGEVVALGVAAGGDWLVSASTDQTIAAWSLAGPDKPDIGARFAVKGDGLTVTSLKTGGAAWEAGLVVGDEIELFAFAAKLVPGGPEAWLKRLQDPVPGKEHYFRLKRLNREGKPVELVTTVRQRPLWRFFPTRDDEWVLWMWRNPYYDTSTKGDFYIGWHINSADKDLAGTPRFYRAEQFRKLLERPEALDEILDSHDPEAALRKVSDNPVPLRFDESEPPAAVLVLGPVRPGEDVAATLKATPHGDNPDNQPFQAELWVNDFRLGAWDNVSTWERQGSSYVKELKIPDNKLRAGRNVVTFQTYNRLGGRSDASPGLLQIERATPQPRLLGVSVGINDYKAAKTGTGGRGTLKNLESARPDAQSMRDAWAAETLYQTATMQPLLDSAAGRDQLLHTLDEVAAKAGPDDRFVLFLAGHGMFLPRKERSTFIFCCPQFDPDHPVETGISSEVLQSKLAAIPCRKLVLFDACHSGEVANPSRQMTPGGQGPIILAACDRSQLSWEDKSLGHGLFTFAVLEALGRNFSAADRNGDGKLDISELFEYTRSRMPHLLRGIGLKEYQQVPTLYLPPNADATIPVASRK